MGKKTEMHMALLIPGGPIGEGEITKPGLKKKNIPVFIL